MTTPRGIRNNNPGNIRVSKDKWKGLAVEQADAEFFTFQDPKWGIRAAARVLQTYREVRGLRTLREIISFWAPSSENDTNSYVTAVSIWADFDPDEDLDVMDYDTVFRLLRAMFRQENGRPPEGQDYWYDNAVYEQGLRLAGLSPNKRLRDSRVAQGTTVAGTAAASAIAVLTDTFGIPPEIAALLPTALSSASEQAVSIVLLVIAVAGTVYSMYARRDDKLKGRL